MKKTILNLMKIFSVQNNSITNYRYGRSSDKQDFYNVIHKKYPGKNSVQNKKKMRKICIC